MIPYQVEHWFETDGGRWRSRFSEVGPGGMIGQTAEFAHGESGSFAECCDAFRGVKSIEEFNARCKEIGRPQ